MVRTKSPKSQPAQAYRSTEHPWKKTRRRLLLSRWIFRRRSSSCSNQIATLSVSGCCAVVGRIGFVVGQPTLGVDGRGAATAGGGDRLPVGAVYQVAGREHTVQRGARGAHPHQYVAVGIDVDDIAH